MTRRTTLLILLSFLFIHCYARQSEIDSLLSALKTAREDTNKVGLLNNLSWNFRTQNAEHALQYGRQALVLANKLGFTKGIGEANINIGIAQNRLGKKDEAIESLKTGLNMCEKIGDKKNVAKAYRNLGIICTKQGQYEEALKDQNYALRLSKEINYVAGIAYYYNDIGVISENQGDYSNALKNYDEAVKIYTENGLTEDLWRTHINIGNVKMEQGNYPESLKNYFSALKVCQQNEDKIGMAYCYGNIGIIYKKQGNYSEALKNHFADLKIEEELKNKEGMASTYGNLSSTFATQGNYKEALKYCSLSLNLKKETGNLKGVVNTSNNLGYLHLLLGDTAQAIDYFSSALIVADSINFKMGLADANGYLGEIYLARGNFSMALQNIMASLTISQNIGNKEGVIDSYFEMGQLNVKLHKLQDATKFINEGIKLADEIGSPNQLKKAYLIMTAIDSSKNDFKKAFEHYKLYTQYKDSLFNEENTKKSVQAQMNYDFEKKEALTKAETDKKAALADAEIKRQKLIRNSTFGGVGIVGIFSFLLIRSYNKRRKTVFEKQVSEVEMKALRSQMNPHFIFNALQSVNDFILKKDTVNASNFVIKFSKLMRSVLENSLNKEVPLEKDISSLELYMQLESSRLEHPFDYEINVDPKIDPETTLVPPLILQPFVENSIWHGLKHKKEKGKIKIEIKEENNNIVCCIEDNGVGREKANTLKEPLSEKIESLGMKLTRERLKILEKVKNFRSRIDVIDLKDALNNPLGLRVELLLPLATLN